MDASVFKLNPEITFFRNDREQLGGGEACFRFFVNFRARVFWSRG